LPCRDISVRPHVDPSISLEGGRHLEEILAPFGIGVAVADKNHGFYSMVAGGDRNDDSSPAQEIQPSCPHGSRIRELRSYRGSRAKVLACRDASLALEAGQADQLPKDATLSKALLQ
jgi:hypothetical protein